MAKIHHDDTIAAIATPPGEGAIAVIRVSGRDAITAISPIFHGKGSLNGAAGYTAHFGRLLTPDGEHVDDVVATIFRSPHSYTGEDSVEVSCHGGHVVARKVLTTVLATGVRQAEPGEFTKRAFLNGKIDLAQAEAIASLIASRSDAQARASMIQLEGRFSAEIRRLRKEVLDLSSLLELELDFSEEGLDLVARDDLLLRLQNVRSEVKRMADSYRKGKVIREGVSVVIVGKPNAGKSSLFNALLRESRAIVTEIPGTTRDFLEENISIGGFLFRLNDTAGLRDTVDPVEVEGVIRSKNLIRQAHLLLLVVDSTEIRSKEETLSYLARKEVPHSVIVVYNKIDIVQGDGQQILQTNPQDPLEHWVSAKTGEGVDELRQKMFTLAVGSDAESGSVQVTNSRHYESLVKSLAALDAVAEAINAALPGEFIALEIRSCADALGEIVGEISTDDMLENIFVQFCVGK